MNTFCKLHPQRLYTWRSPDIITIKQIYYILCKTRWKSSIKRVTTLPGADCSTDHNLLIADIKIKLKRIHRSKQTPIYDVEKFGLDYGIEIQNRFNELISSLLYTLYIIYYIVYTLTYLEPEELWNDIRNILNETG